MKDDSGGVQKYSVQNYNLKSWAESSGRQGRTGKQDDNVARTEIRLQMDSEEQQQAKQVVPDTQDGQEQSQVAVVDSVWGLEAQVLSKIIKITNYGHVIGWIRIYKRLVSDFKRGGEERGDVGGGAHTRGRGSRGRDRRHGQL